MRWGVGMALALGLVSGGAQAGEHIAALADVAKSPLLLAYIKSEPLKKKLFQIGVQWDQARGTACGSGQYTLSVFGPADILVPIDMVAGQLQPVAGLWVLAFAVDRCGHKLPYRLLVGPPATPGAELKMQPLIPGESSASPLMIADVMSDFNERLAKQAGLLCARAFVLDSSPSEILEERVAGYAGAVGQRLKERWWFHACGRQIPVDIEFTPAPDKPGMRFKAELVAEPKPGYQAR